MILLVENPKTLSLDLELNRWLQHLHFLSDLSDHMQLKVGDKFSGWYEAPMSLGKTEFSLEVEKVEEGGEWVGRGKDLTTLSNLGKRLDQARDFTCKGRLTDDEITFTKNFCDGSHTGIRYRGQLKEEDGDVIVGGEYTTQFSKLFIKMEIKENFSMTLIA